MNDEPAGRLAEIGEQGIIEIVARAARDIGDDCAVLDLGAGDQRLLVSTDLLLERVHFRSRFMPARKLGWKSLAVNLSDIAAMGGRAQAALLAFGLRADLDAGWVREFMDGLAACARRHGVDLVGGDTVRSDRDLAICLTVLGLAREDELLRRRGARPGDLIYLGRPTGDSAAGLALLESESERSEDLDPEARSQLIAAHLEPAPQLELGRLLAERHLASAAIDVSDGLLQDLGHLCSQSGVGAELEADGLPVSEAARRLAEALGTQALDWALSGGEEYCLLFCCPEPREAEMLAACEAQLDLRPIPAGRIVEGSGLRVRVGGSWIIPSRFGYSHF
ncbi:MAG: thiamine-phosphate kinase [Deltaproteobacteria bacterium]|nr:thiamine-phosphate kinase [Deltaproteobacteria bacterium]